MLVTTNGRTGLYVGEMVQIRIDDIDFDNAYLHIRAENAKHKKARTVILLPPVVESEELDAREPYLLEFPGCHPLFAQSDGSCALSPFISLLLMLFSEVISS